MDGKADGVKWIHLFEAVTSEAVLIRSHQFTAYCNKIRNVTRNKNHHTDSFNPSLWKILNWIKESKFLSLKLRITLLWYQIHLQMCIFAISLLSLLLLFIPFQIGFLDYILVILIRLILYLYIPKLLFVNGHSYFVYFWIHSVLEVDYVMEKIKHGFLNTFL